MTLKMPTVAAERWEAVDLGDAGSFEIRVRKPSWSDMLADTERLHDYLQPRIEATVVGWRGVQDDQGRELPFSIASLRAVCEAYPPALRQVLQVVGKLYSGDDAKNSEPPPPASSAAETATATA